MSVVVQGGSLPKTEGTAFFVGSVVPIKTGLSRPTRMKSSIYPLKVDSLKTMLSLVTGKRYYCRLLLEIFVDSSLVAVSTHQQSIYIYICTVCSRYCSSTGDSIYVRSRPGTRSLPSQQMNDCIVLYSWNLILSILWKGQTLCVCVCVCVFSVFLTGVILVHYNWCITTGVLLL